MCLGAVLVGYADGRSKIIEIQAYAASARGLTTTRTAGRCPPLMLTTADALQLEIFLRDARIRHVLNFGQRHHRRGDAQSQDRRIGGLTLA